ncbi:MAG TPA: MMPL family transporter [Steroidobacteraceae bacterium]|nr:MMPL family transporter [Steroidobacteraceae bacterium]
MKLSSSQREARFVEWLTPHVFGHRVAIVIAFALITVVMMYAALARLHIDTNFTKQLPLQHEYMQTFVKHQEEFGGANRVLVAVIARDGNMFTPEFFQALRTANDEVFFIRGVDRSLVQSLYTPNVRYTEVVEDGIQAGNVIPADFQPTPEGLAQVRENILKAGIVGRLVANDFSGAIVSATLQDIDPGTGRPLDYIRVAHDLETKIRDRLTGAGKIAVQVQASSAPVEVHMIGFAKIVGDIADGSLSVAMFAGITVLLTILFVWLYIQSLKVALIPVVCSIVAVIWQLGMLVFLGYGVDPLGILVPFIIFAIGVSHGVQKISAVKDAALAGDDSLTAAQRTFRQLFLPAIVALLADLVGFVTILLIPVQVIREMAITASLGVGIVILTDLVLLPVLVSYVTFDTGYRERIERRNTHVLRFWDWLSGVARRGPAAVIIVIAIVLAVLGWWKGRETPIGDTHAGVPELRPDSRYNVDSDIITRKFSIGVDILNVIVETQPDGCIDYDVLTAMDRFAWHMANVDGIQNVLALPGVMKIVSSGWNEGSLKWRNIPRNRDQLVQGQAYLDTTTGLFNSDCSVMPVMMFTTDHRAQTIERVVAEVKKWRAENPTPKATFRLATGNVGVMAATNEEVKAKEYPILAGVFAAVILMCLLTFRSVTGTLCVILPLALGSILAYAVMAMVGIGLKISTLPMVALGVGIGVDYGIYLFSRMQDYLEKGEDVHAAFLHTLRVTGASVIFTGITLAIGVVTWVFSPLKFQADVGILLTFLFVVNMLGAILLLPALAAWLVKPKKA